MKVKIYVNKANYYDPQPRVLTEKQYQKKLQELVTHRMERLVDDDGFEEYLATDYHINEVFFLTEEEKEKIIKEFKSYAIDGAKIELEDYYEEHEIEI